MSKISQPIFGLYSRKNDHLLPRNDVKRRRSIAGLLFSPTFAFVLAVFGYYSLAGFVNVLLPEGSLGAILIRGGILAIIAIAFFRTPRVPMTTTRLALVPVSIFLLAYLMRLIENFYFADIYISPGPQLVFLIFLFSCVASAFALTRMVRAIHDEDLTIVLSGLCIIFLVGMTLNIDLLMQSAERRMMLDKINPISMAHLAFAFLIYYLLVFSRSKRLTIEAMVMAPVLFLIVVYAQSRGAYVSGAGAIAIYMMLLKGTRRIWLFAGLMAVGLVVVYTSAAEHFEVVMNALKRIDVHEDASTLARYTSFYGAWDQFQDDFYFGRYAIELSTGYYPHNIYLESLMAVGFIGTIPFIMHLTLATRAAVGIIRERCFSIAAVLVAVLYFREAIASMASGSLWGNTGFWITSVLVIVFWYGRPKRLKRSMRLGFRVKLAVATGVRRTDTTNLILPKHLV